MPLGQAYSQFQNAAALTAPAPPTGNGSYYNGPSGQQPAYNLGSGQQPAYNLTRGQSGAIAPPTGVIGPSGAYIAAGAAPVQAPPIQTGTPGGNGFSDGAYSTTPTVGNYGQVAANSGPTQTRAIQDQTGQERYSLQNNLNYGDYQNFGTQAQQYGQQAGSALQSPGVASALAQQSALAGGYGQASQQGLRAQGAAIGQLANTASGLGPNVAGLQSQQSVAQAERAQLSAAASARGGAYAQSAAQTQAGASAAGIEGQAAGSAAQVAAQQQLAAEGQYAQAGLGLAQTGNQAQAGQVNAAQAAAASQAAQQTANLQYYEGQQGAAQAQSGLAASLAQSQIANDYGLAGTQLQTQTQQNIANQAQNTQLAGSAVAGTGALIAAALLSTGGSYAGAKGARDAGAPESVAAHIGATVGRSIGVARGGPSLPEGMWQGAQRADAGAAAVAAREPPADEGMTLDEVHGALAQWRAPRAPTAAPPRAAKPPPLGTGEPLERQSYQLGMSLARAYAGVRQ